MKTLLIYFTGTFNTRFLTGQVKKEFEQVGHQVDIVEIHQDTPLACLDQYDLIGLGYPIYGFNSPLPFNQYVKKLKFLPNQKCFIYKNSGETMKINSASSRCLLRWLKHQKVQLLGEYHFVMPYNIHFPFEEAFIKEILQKNQKLLKIMTYQVLNNHIQPLKIKTKYKLGSFFVSIQKIGGPINSYFYKVDKDKCNQCQLCVKQCPQNNIVLKKNKICFKHRCAMCMCCSFYCPKKAISIGMLEKWKIHQYYHLNKIEPATNQDSPYIHQDSKGFYKCFIDHFKKIDETYKQLFETKKE